MFNKSIKNKIINSIQGKNVIRVRYQKESDNGLVTKKIAPYDICSKTKKDSHAERDILIGWEYEEFGHDGHVTKPYLDNFIDIEVLAEKFDSNELKRLANPRNNTPCVTRNW